MKIYHGETLGLLAGVTSTGQSVILNICYLDAGTGWPLSFSFEFGQLSENISGVEEEDARIYREVFGVDVVPDNTEEERNLLVNEITASSAGDIVENAFKGGAYNGTVLYFTGWPDRQGAYSIEQIHGANYEYIKSIPGDLREEISHLANILAKREGRRQ